MQLAAIEKYEIFKKYFSEEDAKIVTESIDESLFRWVANKEDLAKVQTELKENISSVKTELKGDIAGIRENMAKMEGSLRGDMKEMGSLLIRWFIGTDLALTSSPT